MAVTCLILGISGGLRYWRESQFAALAVDSANCPFPLAELPRTIGTWQADQDSETFLDPDVARVAGASEHIVRGYLDEKSGEQATALVLYGLAAASFHTPDICYPAAGYQVVKGPIDRSITVPGVKEPVRYRWAIYTKREGGVNRYEEAYFTFLHHGDWMPDAADRWKMFRYHPGLFKVQISHAVSSLSESGEGPCESLLAEHRPADQRPGVPGKVRRRTTAPATSDPATAARGRTEPRFTRVPASSDPRAPEPARRRLRSPGSGPTPALPDRGDRPRDGQDQQADPAHQQHHQQRGRQIQGQGDRDEPSPNGHPRRSPPSPPMAASRLRLHRIGPGSTWPNPSHDPEGRSTSSGPRVRSRST